MQRTCFLHIGTEKTGSTAIQVFLQRNKETLQSLGYYLPTTLGTPDNRIFSSYFASHVDEFSRQQGVLTEAQKQIYFQSFEAQTTEEIRTGLRDHHSVILSSEHLHSRVKARTDIARIARMLEPLFDRIVVICYFRRQGEMALSLYSTVLKSGWTMSLENFYDMVTPEKYVFNHLESAGNWAAVFGKANCSFRIYPSRQSPGRASFDIRKDFLAALGAAGLEERLVFSTYTDNSSLLISDIAFYRFVNRLLPLLPADGSRRRQITLKLNRLARRLHAWRKRPGHKISSLDAADLDNRFGATNARFLETYFDGNTQL